MKALMLTTASPHHNKSLRRSGMTLLEAIIASSIFVVFVGAALSASAAASSQERLNSNSASLMDDCSRVKANLSGQFNKVAQFEGYNETSKLGTGVFLYPSQPLDPDKPDVLQITDDVMFRANDSTTCSYRFEYIKLRSHPALADDPERLKSSFKNLNNNQTYTGTDGQPLTLLNYINANPTPYVIFDPDATSSQWWVRPVWETDTNGIVSGVGQNLAQNSNPDNLRIYSLLLQPENGINWINIVPAGGVQTVELGNFTLTYSNPGGSTPNPIVLARGVDRHTFNLKVSSGLFILNCVIHRSQTTINAWPTISRNLSLRVPIATIP